MEVRARACLLDYPTVATYNMTAFIVEKLVIVTRETSGWLVCSGQGARTVVGRLEYKV